jgi:hypothetical protein
MKVTLKAWAALAGLLAATAVQAVGVPGQGTWETTLLPRDLDGDALNGPEAFYDTALDVTWLRDTGDANSYKNWDTANTWANTLVVGGIGGWRLPTGVDTGAPGCDFGFVGTDCGYNVDMASSEMAHLYHGTLGNLSSCPPSLIDCSGGPQAGYGLTNTGDFQNMNPYYYWSGQEYATDSTFALVFWMDQGRVDYSAKVHPGYAMAVHPGDVLPAIPEPQTYALMLAGLGALWLRRRLR